MGYRSVRFTGKWTASLYDCNWPDFHWAQVDPQETFAIVPQNGQSRWRFNV
jgi:hypothetical protein